MIKLETALQQVLAFKAEANPAEANPAITPVPELVLMPVLDATSWVLAQNVFADRPLPPFNKALMDGFCAKFADFNGATADLEVIGEVYAGQEPHFHVQTGQAAKIMTGAALPSGADVVIPIEHAQAFNQRVKLDFEGVVAGLYVGLKGQDVHAKELLLSAGTQLNAQRVAVCAAVGLDQVLVYPKPTVFVLTGGAEVVPVTAKPSATQIRDVNQYFLVSSLRKLGLQVRFEQVLKDDFESLKQAIQQAIQPSLKSDVILICGGMSRGAADLSAKVLKSLGAQQAFHGVRLKPGKPLWFGGLGGTAVFGLPGNPVSVQVCFKLFVEPYLNHFCHQKVCGPVYTQYPVLGGVLGVEDLDHFLPAKLLEVNGSVFAQPLGLNNSGDFSKLKDSDGLLRCPARTRQLKANMQADFLAWS